MGSDCRNALNSAAPAPRPPREEPPGAPPAHSVDPLAGLAWSLPDDARAHVVHVHQQNQFNQNLVATLCSGLRETFDHTVQHALVDVVRSLVGGYV